MGRVYLECGVCKGAMLGGDELLTGRVSSSSEELKVKQHHTGL